MTLEPDDAVITPSGRHAQVVRRLADGRLECRYLKRARGEGHGENTVALKDDYLRRIEPGRIAPPPVRVNGTREPHE